MENEMKKRSNTTTLLSKFYIIAAILLALTGFAMQIQARVLTPKVASRAISGATGNKSSNNFSMSADGRYIVFDSNATDLVSGLNVTPNTSNIFLFDAGNNSIRCLSLAAPNTTGNGFSANPIITPDGRFVVFASLASDLVANDTNNHIDIFRADTTTGEIKMVSVNLAGTGGGNNNSGEFSNNAPYDISDNGRFIIFESNATDLANVADTNNTLDVFLRDMAGNATRLISRSASGTSTGNNISLNGNISSDGNIITFDSGASDLIAAGIDNNNFTDVFRRDIQLGQTELVSVNAQQTGPGNKAAFTGSRKNTVSDDGRFIIFDSGATDMLIENTPNPNNGRQFYIRDLSTGQKLIDI
jgi:hypothetical protein